MQMCPNCDKVYDESEYTHCPYCSGEIEPEAEKYKDCPECNGIMYWDGDCWSCSNCSHEIHTDEDDYRKYSLGMKQRLGIAAAIMEQPDLIILDEPTNALDDKGVAQICALIRRERERGALIVLTCHDSSILTSLSDEILTISNGCIERTSVK